MHASDRCRYYLGIKHTVVREVVVGGWVILQVRVFHRRVSNASRCDGELLRSQRRLAFRSSLAQPRLHATGRFV